ncbi:hypothetical protein KR200_003342, partial [Drosophila serrata]
ALRCYICEDCDENSQLTEMEVCDGTPVSSSPSPSPSPGPSPNPSPAAPGAPPSAEEEDYDSDESSTVGIMPAGNGGATGAGGATAGGAPAGGAPAGGGAAAPAVPESAAESEEEEDEEEEEEEDERRRRSSARQAQLDVPTAFCYIVRLHLNESVITKRGCTTARMSNGTGHCDGLFENWSVGGCQLCQDDGCNKPIGESSKGIPGLEASLALTLMAIVGR